MCQLLTKHLTAHPNFHHNVFVILKKKYWGSSHYANFGNFHKTVYAKVVEVLQITQLMQIPLTTYQINENRVSGNHVVGGLPEGFPQYVTKKQYKFIT